MRRRRAPTASPTTGSRRHKRSPAYKMAVDWKIAFPLHPEYRTLPMVWYVPPLSPIQSHANAGAIETVGEIPDVRSLRIPVRYLANLLTAGAEAPIVTALERMLAMRIYFRQRQLGEGDGQAVLDQVGLTVAQVEDMHRYLAIANYEDRFVIPTSHREEAEDAYGLKGSCGFTLRQWLRLRAAAFHAVRRQDGSTQAEPGTAAGYMRRTSMIVFRALSALLSYPSEDMRRALPEIADIVRDRAARCAPPSGTIFST